MYAKPVIRPVSNNEGTTERGICNSDWCTSNDYVVVTSGAALAVEVLVAYLAAVLEAGTPDK